MSKTIESIIWFLKNPKYIPQIFQILKRKKNKTLENTSEEATQWCKENSISQKKALKLLVDLDDFEDLTHLFPKDMKEAQDQANNCPVNMGGEGATSFIYHIVKKLECKNVIETGVAYGWSSLAILLGIKDINKAKLISNDMPYIKMDNEDFVGCVIPDNLKFKWELQRQPDIKGIPIAMKKFNNSIDLCHYDSDKSYTGRMWASPILWNSLNKGGIFIADDINDNIAFKHFCQSVDREPVIIEHLGKYVGIIKK